MTYILRVGKHSRKDNPTDLIHVEAGNLPTWANGSARDFWRTADKTERLNGAAYREFELALPSELTASQKVALVKDFLVQQIKQKPYTYAIHAPTAALGDCPQPHVHVMVSDRLPDHFDRPAEQHFRRYNGEHPELGGCKKDSGGKDRLVVRNELIETRKVWAELTNAHLEKCGHQARVDHRSNEDRGIQQRPVSILAPHACARLRKVCTSCRTNGS